MRKGREYMLKKKVLVIIPDRFEKASGGMGTNSAPVFERLSSDYEFYVVGFPLEGTSVPSFVAAYRAVSSFYTETKFGPLDTLLAQARYVAEALKFPKPDLVYAYDWSIYQAAVEVADFFKVPLVARMCLSPILLGEQGQTFGLNLEIAAEKAIHNALCEMEIRGLKRADRVVHISRGYRAQYEKFFSFAKKIRLVENGIDLAEWRGEIEPYFLPGGIGRKKIIFLGRLTEVKGVLSLCKARVPKEIDLIFIGPRNSADLLCMRAIEQTVEKENNVYFLGALYGQDKIRAVRAADALIVSSQHEPFGTVGLEGLAAGCVVLSSRVGGLADYLNNETSIFCGTQPEEIEAAYHSLLILSKRNQDSMRTAGFEICRTYTTESSARKLDASFRELLS